MLHRAFALLLVPPFAVPTGFVESIPTSLAIQDERKAEFEKKLAEAEGNVQKLWTVYEWCESNGLDKDGRTVLRKILKLDDKQKKAHELLGELEFDGKWFPNQKKLDEYKAKKLEEDAKKAGKVVYKGEIVDPADVPYLEKGMKKLEDGRWVDAEEHKRVTEGWVKQDFEWVAPADAPNIAKGLWKCGDKWLTEAEANTFHSEIGKWWKIPADHFVVYSTCDRALALKARDECDRAYRECNRVLGKVPTSPVAILILRSAEQYNGFAGSQGIELRGFSSIHGATVAEIWAEPLQAGMTSSGFCFWDASNEKENAFGPMYVRHAAAQSIAEAMDPSPKTLAALAAQKPGADPQKDWWAEKKLPQWFRYGLCGYAERYMVDQFVKPGGDANWMRKWSIENIANKGGIDPLDQIFGLGLTLEDIPKSQKLLNEAGLLLSFVVDGKCAAVTKEHAALKDALMNGKEIKGPMKNLEEAIRKNEEALRKYAGI
jgi:hypothetical protein